MRVLTPTAITAANYYLYSNIDSGDYAEWNVATAYVAGNRVIIDAQKSQYECILGNTGQNPAAAGSTYWVRVGSTIAWRPFDGVLSTQQQVAGYYHLISTPELWGGDQLTGATKSYFPLMGLGPINCVAVLGTDCCFVNVKCYNRDGVATYNRTIYSVDTAPVIDAWTYCFSDLNVARDFVFDEIDGWGTTIYDQIHVYVSGEGVPYTVRVGEIIAGIATDIGSCHADAQMSLVDYSRKEVDAYGTISITQRAYSWSGTFDVEIPIERSNRVKNLIASLRATPAVYFPTDGDANGGLVIYGYVKDYNVTYSTPEREYFTVQIEGLI